MPELQRGAQRGHLVPSPSSYMGPSEKRERERERERGREREKESEREKYTSFIPC